MRTEDKPTWRQKLFEYRVFLKPFICILPVLIITGIFYYFHISKEEKYSTAAPDLRPIPAIALPDRTGKLHRLNELKEPGIVVFWASWCGPCRMMAPAFEQAAASLASEAILAKLNTEVAQRTAAAYGISSIPTLICFQNGQEVQRQAGALSAPQIVSWMRSLSSSH